MNADNNNYYCFITAIFINYYYYYLGQTFQSKIISKIQYLNKHYPRLKHIAVDGGMNLDTVNLVAKAGANMIISGSSIFNVPINNIIEIGYNYMNLVNSVN